MTPQAAQIIAKANKLLTDAETMLGVGLNDAAGRSAYLAGFHAAQAFIFESQAKIAKTHNGVQTEFARLTKDNAGFDGETRSFLSRTYNLKAIADYETGPGSEVSVDRAQQAIEEAKRFVAKITHLVAGPQQADD